MPIVIVALVGLFALLGVVVASLHQVRSRLSFPNAWNHPGRNRGFANDNLVWTVVGVLAIVALLIYLVRGR